MALRALVIAAILSLTAAFAPGQSAAAHEGGSGNGVSLLRDTEIETDIHTMMTPIWKAAGLDPDAVHVYLVSDGSINSFVAGGQNIFINSGLLLHADTPNQLIGVLAHETGHIAGGHIYKGAEAMHNASIEEIIAMVAGVAATVAATRQRRRWRAIGRSRCRAARVSGVFGDPGGDCRSRGDELPRSPPINQRAACCNFLKSCRAKSC